MKILITGASSGIGKACSELLSAKGHKILTLKSRFENLDDLLKEVRNLEQKHEISVVILSAGFGIFAPLEAMNTDEILRLINVNLSANILICRELLKNLKRNCAHIIGIASIEALRFSRFSSVYSASKAGLRAFLLSLFEDVRKEIKVTCISPDITKTAFFDNLNFGVSDDENSYIDADEIANFVLEILQTKSNVSEFVIRPRIVQINKIKHK